MAVKDWKDFPDTSTPIDAAALEDLETRLLGEAATASAAEAALRVAKTVIAASGMGVVVHGSTAATARPAGYKQVTWIGSVEPTNAAEYDVWIEA